jgi:hypothetical protein
LLPATTGRRTPRRSGTHSTGRKYHVLHKYAGPQGRAHRDGWCPEPDGATRSVPLQVRHDRGLRCRVGLSSFRRADARHRRAIPARGGCPGFRRGGARSSGIRARALYGPAGPLADLRLRGRGRELRSPGNPALARAVQRIIGWTPPSPVCLAPYVGNQECYGDGAVTRVDDAVPVPSSLYSIRGTGASRKPIQPTRRRCVMPIGRRGSRSSMLPARIR